MKIFISWSGEASKRIGGIFRTYLPIFFQDCVFFMSKHDLESGVRWSAELATELGESDFGIICLMPDNLTAPWVLFEAGALSKHIKGRACCVLFGGLTPSDVTEPLSQFQNRLFSEDAFGQLLRDINKLRSSPMDAAAFGKLIEKFWPDISKEIAGVLTEERPQASAKRPSEEILEEILVRVRMMENRMEAVAATATSVVLPSLVVLLNLSPKRSHIMSTELTKARATSGISSQGYFGILAVLSATSNPNGGETALGSPKALEDLRGLQLRISHPPHQIGHFRWQSQLV
jgi:hypothetical protein